MVVTSGHGLRLVGSLAVLALAGATAVQAQQELRVVTLDQAVRLALQNDPAAVAAEMAVSGARAANQVAAAAWLPSLAATSWYTNSSNERFDQSSGRLVSESFNAGLAAGYDIFTGGRRMAQQRSTRAEYGAAAALERAQTFQTTLAAKELYYDAQAAGELVRTAQQRMERAEQQLVFARTRLEVGSATRSDLLRAELELGNAELSVVDAESALRSARLRLGRLLGFDEQIQPADSELPARAPTLPEIEVLARRAELASPAAVAAEATHRARRADVQAAYTGYLPTLRLTGGYDWLGVDFPPSQESWSYRVTMSFPIFNNMQREAGVVRARATERLAEARARDAVIGARIAAEDAAREVSAAERRVGIADRAVELAREDLRVQEERYQIGAALILDLQTSQVALAEAEVASVRARQALATSLARLEAVLGESLDGVQANLTPGVE
jgi:outer membrane protein